MSALLTCGPPAVFLKVAQFDNREPTFWLFSEYISGAAQNGGSMSEIMTPQHPRWDEFVDLLEGPEGCNIHKTGQGPQWNCDGNDKPLTRAILAKHFPEVDIEATMKFFNDHGGYCDCEIPLNVGPEDS
jgi:hypothetical protein